MTVDELKSESRNINMTQETVELVHDFFEKMKELELEGISGVFRVIEDEEESNFAVMLEEFWLKKRQHELINEPFVI
ncbi:MAG: hypothetical protein LBN08_03380 [Lactobacillales bacterium]|nr:hypothetical protein [Lactobacillales bacterium]